MKHTPGPWNYGGVITAGANAEIGIAQIMGARSDDEVFANAQLISAAPDLLAALKWIGSGGHYLGACIRRANEAIALAEGHVSLVVESKPTPQWPGPPVCKTREELAALEADEHETHLGGAV